jgi:hypothetical protein
MFHLLTQCVKVGPLCYEIGPAKTSSAREAQISFAMRSGDDMTVCDTKKEKKKTVRPGFLRLQPRRHARCTDPRQQHHSTRGQNGAQACHLLVQLRRMVRAEPSSPIPPSWLLKLTFRLDVAGKGRSLRWGGRKFRLWAGTGTGRLHPLRG